MPTHTTVPGNSSGRHLRPVTKFLLHKTEGSSIAGAVAAYKANNSWPHMTVDSSEDTICHHLGLDVAARALRNLPGGVETNTAGVIQIEIVGFSADPSDTDWEWIGRHVAGPTCREIGIPLQAAVRWVGSEGYGQGAAQRLSGVAWLSYVGVLGHQHAPENTHWDPGIIPIELLLDAAALPGPSPIPVQEDSMILHSKQTGGKYVVGAAGWRYLTPGEAQAWTDAGVKTVSVDQSVIDAIPTAVADAVWRDQDTGAVYRVDASGKRHLGGSEYAAIGQNNLARQVNVTTALMDEIPDSGTPAA